MRALLTWPLRCLVYALIPGWLAIGTRPDGVQVVTDTVDSPADALRALLDAP